MSDLTKRLCDKTRLRKNFGITGWVLHEEALTVEAADEIERLNKRIAKLESALQSVLAEELQVCDDTSWDSVVRMAERFGDIARQGLGQKIPDKSYRDNMLP